MNLSSYSSHYAQAYFNAQVPTFSSYHPQPQPQGSWYQHGNSRCRKPDCHFTGSSKSVEIHMMDRHLIFPPGWDSNQKKIDWDADPSLKGKPIPIQGTNLILDTPEALEAWVAERKKRWPTAGRVEEKKRKMEEAISRGQFMLEDDSKSRKRQRRDPPDGSSGHGGQDRRGGRGNARGRSGRGRGRGRGQGYSENTDNGWEKNVNQEERTSLQLAPPGVLPPKPNFTLESHTKNPVIDSAIESSGSDDEPEVVSSKVPTTPSPPVIADVPSDLEPLKKRPARFPKKQPQNPFATRPTLLRNLLLPEIRVTISNLSQAIRFIVDNDFLRGVELNAGEATENMIEVIHEAKTPTSK